MPLYSTRTTSEGYRYTTTRLRALAFTFTAHWLGHTPFGDYNTYKLLERKYYLFKVGRCLFR